MLKNSGNNTPMEIDKILDSLDGMSRAEVPPFFYTRVMAGLDRQGGFTSLWIGKPVVSMVTVALLLIFNLATLNYFISYKQQQLNPATGIQRFAQEYDLLSTSVTDKTVTP